MVGGEVTPAARPPGAGSPIVARGKTKGTPPASKSAGGAGRPRFEVGLGGVTVGAGSAGSEPSAGGWASCWKPAWLQILLLVPPDEGICCLCHFIVCGCPQNMQTWARLQSPSHGLPLFHL